MALYLEVPDDVNKAEQIIGLTDAEAVGELSWPPASLRVYVCVTQYRTPHPHTSPLEAARIMATADEFYAHTHTSDAHYRTWLSVPMGRVLEQHPMLDISQASPGTKVKRRSPKAQETRMEVRAGAMLPGLPD